MTGLSLGSHVDEIVHQVGFLDCGKRCLSFTFGDKLRTRCLTVVQK